MPDIWLPHVQDKGVFAVAAPTDFSACPEQESDVGGQQERDVFLRTRGECGDDMETDMKREKRSVGINMWKAI